MAGFGDIFESMFGAVKKTTPTPAKTPSTDPSQDTPETRAIRRAGQFQGVQAGFRMAKVAAANKARVLGYEALARDIEKMTIDRKE